MRGDAGFEDSGGTTVAGSCVAWMAASPHGVSWACDLLHRGPLVSAVACSPENHRRHFLSLRQSHNNNNKGPRRAPAGGHNNKKQHEKEKIKLGNDRETLMLWFSTKAVHMISL